MRTITPDIQEIQFKYKNPRGLIDILPESQRYWQHGEALLTQISSSFGYHRVITPPVEARSLYTLAFGDDFNRYLIDSNITDGDESYVFSAHPRVSLIRSFKENGFANWPPPVHLYYQASPIQSVKDGYQQRHFFCLDVLGARDVTTNATMLILLRKLAQELKLKRSSLMMHSSGCNDCRPTYNEIAEQYIKPHVGSLCESCAAHPSIANVTNCEVDAVSEWLAEAPALMDHLCPLCHSQLTSVLEACDELGIAYDMNPLLFANCPEAEQTTFSLRINDEVIPAIIGYHYDKLATTLAEQPLTAIGLSIDMQRLTRYLEHDHASLPNQAGIQIFVAQLGQQAKLKCLPLLHELYEAGYSATTASESESITHQLQVAERLRAKITLIVGQKEAVNGHVIMRDMLSGLQDNVYLDELIPVLQERLAVV